MISASIDIETTGLEAGVHEIVQLAVIPFNEKFEPMGRFVSYIKPLRPELADPTALELNHLNLTELNKAPTPAQVRSCFIEWKEDLFGQEQICPLGHNYASFDSQFLKLFLTSQLYGKLFSYRVEDTSILARALKRVGLLPKELKGSLSSLREFFKVDCTVEHDAYEDALSTIKVYKKMLSLIQIGGQK